MLYIEKSTPPQVYQRAVAQIKGTPTWRSIRDGDTEAIRTQFDLLPKSEIRDALFAEQHHLCAYCMKRIRNDMRMSIEHLSPLSQDKEGALDYKNFLGVCKGGADSNGPRNRVLCCDASKGDETSLTVNPLDREMMRYIAYMEDGTIYCLSDAGSMTEQINHDLNEILHLNGRGNQDTATGLKKGRRDAYLLSERICNRLRNQGQLTPAQIKRKIQQLRQKEEYQEFLGTILFFLERKQKILESSEKMGSKDVCK